MKTKKLVVRGTELAAIHGVTTRCIRKWVAAGMPRVDKDRYNPTQTIQWLVLRDRYR